MPGGGWIQGLQVQEEVLRQAPAVDPRLGGRRACEGELELPRLVQLDLQAADVFEHLLAE